MALRRMTTITDRIDRRSTKMSRRGSAAKALFREEEDSGRGRTDVVVCLTNF